MASEKPSAWAMDMSRHYANVSSAIRSIDAEGFAHILDAAEQRGFDRAVNETAIASIHKAVAAERAAIVAWLHSAPCTAAGHDPRWCEACERRSDLAHAIERGEHHPKEAT